MHVHVCPVYRQIFILNNTKCLYFVTVIEHYINKQKRTLRAGIWDHAIRKIITQDHGTS